MEAAWVEAVGVERGVGRNRLAREEGRERYTVPTEASAPESQNLDGCAVVPVGSEVFVTSTDTRTESGTDTHTECGRDTQTESGQGSRTASLSDVGISELSPDKLMLGLDTSTVQSDKLTAASILGADTLPSGLLEVLDAGKTQPPAAGMVNKLDEGPARTGLGGRAQTGKGGPDSATLSTGTDTESALLAQEETQTTVTEVTAESMESAPLAQEEPPRGALAQPPFDHVEMKASVEDDDRHSSVDSSVISVTSVSHQLPLAQSATQSQGEVDPQHDVMSPHDTISALAEASRCVRVCACVCVCVCVCVSVCVCPCTCER